MLTNASGGKIFGGCGGPCAPCWLIASRDDRIEAIEVRVGPNGLTVAAREPEPIAQG